MAFQNYGNQYARIKVAGGSRYDSINQLMPNSMLFGLGQQQQHQPSGTSGTSGLNIEVPEVPEGQRPDNARPKDFYDGFAGQKSQCLTIDGSVMSQAINYNVAANTAYMKQQLLTSLSGSGIFNGYPISGETPDFVYPLIEQMRVEPIEQMRVAP